MTATENDTARDWTISRLHDGEWYRSNITTTERGVTALVATYHAVTGDTYTIRER